RLPARIRAHPAKGTAGRMWEGNLTELFNRGGPVMWPLLFCSVVGVALILERGAVIVWGSVRFGPLIDRLRPLLRGRRLDQARRLLLRSRTPVARVALTYLDHLESPPALREDVVAREASRELARLERRLNWLGLIAQVTPLLGLLGTVLGLMTAFYQ